MFEWLQDWLQGQGVTPELAAATVKVSTILAILLLSAVANIVAKRYLLTGLRYVIARTKTSWDDAFLERKVFNRLAHLAPALIIYTLMPDALTDWPAIASMVRGIALIYMIAVLILSLDAFLNTVVDIYRTFDIAREMPIKGFIQVAKIVLYFLAAIFIISILLNKTPLYFLSGLGALTAVLMLIFKDAILGFVAGIQLTANKMVAHGDWIAMPRYGADGDVLEVTLTTVKVQNWDKTITTIPTYALISESFKNWRGMSQSGGRRIKRAINIDMNTIKFCDEAMLERFAKIQYISEYIEKTKVDLSKHNQNAEVDNSSLVNGRRMTNIGTFRAYVAAYLKHHPMVNLDMTFLIRQLRPSENGLPLQIYVFSKDQAWVSYEAIQSDIFDHLLAVVPEFDLRVFQHPTGGDFQLLSMASRQEAHV